MSQECSRGAEVQEPCSSKGDRPAHIQRPISRRLQEGAQEQEWTLTLHHPQAPQAEVLRDCPRPGASLTRAGRFLGTTREATGTAFFCGPVGSTEESMGLFINLTLTGQRAGAGKVCRMEHISHYLAPGGNGGGGGGDWSLSVHGVPTGPVRCTQATPRGLLRRCSSQMSISN